MRLIDADAVMEMLSNIELSCTAIPMIEAKTRLRDIPTAYDVDRVVERLQEKMKNLVNGAEDYEKVGNFEMAEIYSERANDYRNTIKIVKAGGISE